MSGDVFRSRLNRRLAVGIWLIAAISLVGAAVAAGDQSWRTVPFAALVAFVAWIALWRPEVSVDDSGVTLVNVSHSAMIPWEAVIDVDTKYALSIRTPTRVYSAFAAPAPGRLGSRAALRREPPADDRDPFAPDMPGERTSDLPTTESGAAAQLVRRRWTRLLDDGRVIIGAADTARVEVRVHVVALAASAVLLAACGVATYA